MKHYITKALLCLCMALLLFNCQKEEITTETQTKTSSTNFSMLRSKAIENDKGLMRILEHAEEKKQENRANKTIYNAQYDFTVNTNYAKVITNEDGLHSYTFGVYRDEDNGLLENLLLKEQTDGTFLVYLVDYNLSQTERNTLANKNIVDVDNKITYTPLEDISSSIFSKTSATAETCTVYSYEWEGGNTCSAGGNHSYEDGSSCTGWGTDLAATSSGWSLTSQEVDCGSGDSTNTETDNNTTNTNQNNTNSNGAGNYTPNPDTTPVLCPDCPEVEEEEEDCEVDEATLSQLQSYFGHGNISQNCSLDLSTSINFSDAQGLIDIYEDLKTIDSDDSSDEETQQDGSIVTNFRVKLRDVPSNEISIDIDLKFIPDDFDTEEDEFQYVNTFTGIIKGALIWNWSMTQGADYFEEQEPGVEPWAKIYVISFYVNGKAGIDTLGYESSGKMTIKCKFNKYTGQNLGTELIES